MVTKFQVRSSDVASNWVEATMITMAEAQMLQELAKITLR